MELVEVMEVGLMGTRLRRMMIEEEGGGITVDGGGRTEF